MTALHSTDLSVELISDSAIHQSLFVSALWSLNCLLYAFPASVVIIRLLLTQQQYWGKYMYLNIFPEIMTRDQASICLLPP